MTAPLRRLGFALLLLASIGAAGCDLCWPRGGSLGRCVADDDDTGDDDDSGGDDDDTTGGDDDDSTGDEPPCTEGELIIGPTFSYDPGNGNTIVGTYDLICIHPATFRMGFENDDPGHDEGEEAHDVTLTRAYAIGVWEVPQSLFLEVTGENNSDCGDEEGCTDLSPVNRVSWTESLEFANELSTNEGLTPVYWETGGIWMQDLDADGYRLPTEAEWEYAARGGEDWEYSGSDEVDDVAWCDSFSDNYPKPVGLKDGNGYGLHDMSGNINEWVWDGYEDYDLSPQTDPTGPVDAFFKVRRGGTFDYQCELTRVRNRSWDTGSRMYNQGLRLARTMWVPREPQD